MDKNSYYDLPDRHTMRLQSYDYRQPGYYYVTLCVAQKQCLLSEIVNAEVHLSLCGSIVESEWNRLSERFQHVCLDEYVIMPNHFHGIIIFEGSSLLLEDKGKSHIHDRFRQYRNSTEHIQQVTRPTLQDRAKAKELPTLGEVVRTFKAACTYYIRKAIAPEFAWQGKLYEHVIRNTSDLTRVRNYINNNPTSWQEDLLHPISSS